MTRPKIKLLNLFGCMALALVISGCAGKKTSGEASKETIPLVGELKVHRYTLNNGLRLLVVEDHSSPTFAYFTWFRVGSRDETVGRTGLAHLFEHMMFKETTNHKEGEFDRILEGAGAEGENAFTSRDYTAYVQEMPKERLDLIAQLESDRMHNLVVNDNAFKTEREVVQNERRFRTENSPDGTMYQELFQIGFTQHPYHWPVIGWTQDLNAMVAQDAANFYRAFYAPNHATIVVTGDVNASDVLKTVEKYYGGLAPMPGQPHQVPQEPEQTSPRRKTLRLNIQVDKLLMGYHIPAIKDADIPALVMLQTVLTSGNSSRLHRALVDTGIASMVDSYSFDDKDPSLFVIMANLQKGKRAAQAETVVQREIGRIAREPVSEKELERAKNRMKFDFLENLSSNASRAQFLGLYEAIAGNFEFGLDLEKNLAAVTPTQITAVAKKYFKPSNRSVVVGTPKASK